jgi:predicted nucleic acid-binding protein
VTGDRDLLALREYEGLAILPPRAFLDLLER